MGARFIPAVFFVYRYMVLQLVGLISESLQ